MFKVPSEPVVVAIPDWSRGVICSVIEGIGGNELPRCALGRKACLKSIAELSLDERYVAQCSTAVMKGTLMVGANKDSVKYFTQGPRDFSATSLELV